MADTSSQQGTTSLADIAAALIQPAPTPEAEQQDEERTDDIEEQTTDDSSEDLADDQVDDDVEDSEEDTPDDDDDLEEGVDFFRLTVDGEEQDVTLDELKTSYQIQGAAQKRLNEATAERANAREEGLREGMQAAQAEITQRTETLNSAQAALQEILQALGQRVFTPRVPQPDKSLRETDFVRYSIEKDEFDEEMAEIQKLQGVVGQYLAGQSQQQHEQMQQTRQEQGRLLRSEREDLRTKEGQQIFTARVRAAQQAVGFTQEEVDNYPDRRGLLLLEMAGKFLESQGAIQQESPQAQVVQKAKKTLRPGANRQGKSRRQKQRSADRERAAKTGDYRDVARLLY